MERREAPGACEAPWWQPVLYSRTAGATLPERVCEAHSDGFARPIPRRARAVIFQACEASPPNRCASRRSTSRYRACPISAGTSTDAALTASAPKDLGLFSCPAFGLLAPV